jgi:hypothetical protein
MTLWVSQPKTVTLDQRSSVLEYPLSLLEKLAGFIDCFETIKFVNLATKWLQIGTRGGGMYQLNKLNYGTLW